MPTQSLRRVLGARLEAHQCWRALSVIAFAATALAAAAPALAATAHVGHDGTRVGRGGTRVDRGGTRVGRGGTRVGRGAGRGCRGSRVRRAERAGEPMAVLHSAASSEETLCGRRRWGPTHWRPDKTWVEYAARISNGRGRAASVWWSFAMITRSFKSHRPRFNASTAGAMKERSICATASKKVHVGLECSMEPISIDQRHRALRLRDSRRRHPAAEATEILFHRARPISLASRRRGRRQCQVMGQQARVRYEPIHAQCPGAAPLRVDLRAASTAPAPLRVDSRVDVDGGRTAAKPQAGDGPPQAQRRDRRFAAPLASIIDRMVVQPHFDFGAQSTQRGNGGTSSPCASAMLAPIERAGSNVSVTCGRSPICGPTIGSHPHREAPVWTRVLEHAQKVCAF